MKHVIFTSSYISFFKKDITCLINKFVFKLILEKVTKVRTCGIGEDKWILPTRHFHFVVYLFFFKDITCLINKFVFTTDIGESDSSADLRGAGRGARVAGQHKQKYVSLSKSQISLHLCAVLPESLSATVCEPRPQGFFSEDADQTSRTA